MSQVLGILKNTFKPTLVQKFSRIKVYNALALLNILFGSEIWTFGEKDKYDWHQWRWNFSEEYPGTPFLPSKRNKEILEKLKLEPVGEKLRRYKSNWLWHATRIDKKQQDAKNNAEL